MRTQLRALAAMVVIAASVVASCGGAQGRARASALEDACSAAAAKYARCGSWLAPDAMARSCRAGSACLAREMRADAENAYIDCEVRGPCGDCRAMVGRQLTEPPRLAEIRRHCSASPIEVCDDEVSGPCRTFREDPGLRLFADETWIPFVDCFRTPDCNARARCLAARLDEQQNRLATCMAEAAR